MRCVNAMNLDELLPQLLTRTCPWLLGEGDCNDRVHNNRIDNDGTDNDIIIACRICLARNLIGFPFPVRTTEQDRRLIRDTVRQAAENVRDHYFDNYCFADTQTLPPLDREFLQERQLISQELAASELTYAVLIDHQERFCVVVDEEDHIQIHTAASGFTPQKVWQQINEIDDRLGEKLDYVFHEKYGFLTSSVTNVGTGTRISAILHLPGLVITGEIDKVARSLQKKNLTFRSLYNEGSQAHGDFFLVGNRITLGKSEEELIAKMLDLVPQITAYERQARNFLVNNRREIILDRCSRAAGVLRTAQTISIAETMLHLSNLRLGIHTGLLKGFDIGTINLLLLHTQPAHLQKIQDATLSLAEQDVVRAAYIRQRISRTAEPQS